MSNPRIRGLVVLAVGILVAWLACIMPAFFWLPNAGLGIALPVITVPGEPVHYNWIGNFTLVNTLMGGWFASLLVILWVVLNYRSTNGWKREIPDRWQAWTEVFIETVYNFFDGLGGEKFRKAPLLWPLTAAIFIFLLAGNLGKLVPGFESVGYIHCGYPGFTGYARQMGIGLSSRLWVDRSLDAGVSQTEETEAICQEAIKVNGTYYGDYDPAKYEEQRIEHFARLAAIGADVPDEYAALLTTVDATATPSGYTLISFDAVEEEPEDGGTTVLGADLEADGQCELPPMMAVAEDHGEEAAAEEEAGEDAAGEEEAPAEEEDAAEEAASEIVLMSNLAVEEGEAHGESESALARFHQPEPAEVAAAYEQLVDAEERFANGEISAGLLEEAQCRVTQMIHPGAVFPMSADELQANRIQPYIFTVAPFFRGVSTDLSFNFGLAILSILAVQVYGVIALGPAYFEKFINITALGNLGKKPMGLIDFVVGVIEIISEIGKIISLAFRLFGNLFAGGIALIAFTFLIAFLLPGVMFFLELIIGTVQALVFAVLTLVFSVQAMESHHGDEHDDHH